MAVSPNPATNLVISPEHGGYAWYSANSVFDTNNYGAHLAANGNTDTGSGAAGISWAMGVQNTLGWWQCDWAIPQTIDRVIIYDRGPSDGTTFGTAGTITFSDGTSVNWSGLTDGGSLTINFSARRVAWFRVTATAGAAGFAGLAEVQAFNTSAEDALGAGSQNWGASGAPTVVLPSGAVGDILIAALSWKSAAAPATPSGWELVEDAGSINSGGFDFAGLRTYMRVADGSEGNTLAFAATGTKWALILTRIPSALATRVVASSNNTTTSNTVTATASALDTGATLLALAVASNGSSASSVWSLPSGGWTKHGDEQTEADLPNTNTGLAIFLKAHAGGSTGTPSSNHSQGDAKAAQLIALGIGAPRATMVII